MTTWHGSRQEGHGCEPGRSISKANFSSKLLDDVGEWVGRFLGPAREFIRVLGSPYLLHWLCVGY
jgi:hypothetical protein